MLYPVIDIGSNTVKIAVLDDENLFKQAPVFFKAVPLNIKSKIVDSRLPQEAIEELSLLIKSFDEIAKRLTSVPPIAFATASLRGLTNMDQVLKRVEEVSGIQVEVSLLFFSGSTWLCFGKSRYFRRFGRRLHRAACLSGKPRRWFSLPPLWLLDLVSRLF